MMTQSLAAFFFVVGVCLGEIGVNPDAPSSEINLDRLDYLVHTDEGRFILQTEYVGIKKGKRKPWTVAELPENLPKNRYDDLLAFDETRVILEPRSYDDSDYINANYIDGYLGEKEYVATQGPLPNTTKDFWAMIWQLKVEKIVMLANLMEHGQPKVSKYWEDDVGTYGDFIVTKLSENDMPEIKHVVRSFSIRKVGVLPPRIVRQFHYTGWPDLGVPDDRMPVLALIEQVKKYKPESKEPIVTHCSAGVGRTGTVILLDSMLEMARTEEVMDFPKRLDHMRLQRVDLVETKDQYIFAHEAVYDYFHGNRTEEYLKRVDALHKAGDDDLLRSEFKVPGSLEENLEQIKWYNHRMSVLIEAAEQRLGEEAKE